jgi:hypothetical protein
MGPPQQSSHGRRDVAPAVCAGNAVNRNAANPKEYSVIPPNSRAVLKTANDKIMERLPWM